MASRPRTIDEYLAALSQDRRNALERLRRTIHKIVPKVEECISYSMPAFRFEGHVIAGFLSTKAGCSYFPFSGSTLSSLVDELSEYDQTKGALHFDPKRPLPVLLVKKLLNARIAETQSQGTQGTVKKAKGRIVRTRQ